MKYFINFLLAGKSILCVFKSFHYMYACMYVFLSATPFIFWHTSSCSDRSTLPIANRNPNIFTVIPSLRFSLPLTSFLLLATLHRSTQCPFPRRCSSDEDCCVEQASTCVRPLDRHNALWNHTDRQVTAKQLTNMSKLTLVGFELASPGQWFAARFKQTP